MNRQEKIISILLGVALVWCLFSGGGSKKSEPQKKAAARPPAAERAEAQPAAAGQQKQPEAKAAPERDAAAADFASLPAPKVPEQTVVLGDSELEIHVSTWGAVVKKAVLKEYSVEAGERGEKNPPVEIDYSASPLGAVYGVPGLAPNDAYSIVSQSEKSVLLTNGILKRTIELRDGYRISVEDEFFDGRAPSGENAVSVGLMKMGRKDGDSLSVDSWSMDEKGGHVVHHDDDDTPLKALLAGGASGGCGGCGASRPAGGPIATVATIPGEQSWIAIKDRFFVTALVSSSRRNVGFRARVRRDATRSEFRLADVGADVLFADGGARRLDFFIGPKRQSLLWDLGMRDVMEFGMWRWLCYPVVWLLRTFHSVVPSYGIAIILLTILVRLIFWPLTRKSTEGMKKMQELQPLLKEIQAKYKDNPQRLQQETWALYREKKVNPLSSCLPMLVQIPVFIALFNVLRSAVELRYAGFLWISDLSEPEHLFPGIFPFGGLNPLPILMAVTMYLQSKLTPQTGDKSQQRMMTVFMPVMMLVMFYNFASALSLYWTLSQCMSILQAWMIRRSAQRAAAVEAEVIPPSAPTRQMRRHGAQES
jgi:YidC/Oxa1 family membrane protein insertase